MNLWALETLARMSLRGESITERCNLMLAKGLLTRIEYLCLVSKSLQPAGIGPGDSRSLVAFDGGSSPDQRWA